MNKALFTRSLVTVVLIVASVLIIITAGIAGVLIAVPAGIVLAAIAFFRSSQAGGAARIGVAHMETEAKSRWKLLLLVIGTCVATLVGMAAYAFSLEEWGAARTMIFNLGGMLLMGTVLVALVLLISDFIGSTARKAGS